MLIGVSGRMTWQPGQNGLEAGTVVLAEHREAWAGAIESERVMGGRRMLSESEC